MNQWHHTDNFPKLYYKLIYYYSSYERAKVIWLSECELFWLFWSERNSAAVKQRLQRAKEAIAVVMNSPWSPGEILLAGASVIAPQF